MPNYTHMNIIYMNDLPPNSQNDGRNTFVIVLVEMCKGTNMFIANGRLGEDHGIGSFTCYAEKGQSVVDYLLIGAALKQNLKTFRTDKLMYYMDHCTVVCSFIFQCNNTEELELLLGKGYVANMCLLSF